MTEQEENRMRANIIQRAYDAGREAQLQIQNLQEEINHLRAELEHLNRKIAHGCIDALCSECDKEKDMWSDVVRRQIQDLELIASWASQVNMGGVRDHIRGAVWILKQELESDRCLEEATGKQIGKDRCDERHYPMQ